MAANKKNSCQDETGMSGGSHFDLRTWGLFFIRENSSCHERLRIRHGKGDDQPERDKVVIGKNIINRNSKSKNISRTIPVPGIWISFLQACKPNGQ
jgi:hypothetical protein